MPVWGLLLLWLTAPAYWTEAHHLRVEDFSQLIERCRSGVASVEVEVMPGVEAIWPLDPWHLFPEAKQRKSVTGIGSAVVLREDGLLVTNLHVVAKARRIWVRLPDLGERMPAELVGRDPRSDLALLRVKSSRKLKPLPLGDSDALPVGAWVLALGHPFGLSHVATKGIVSGKGRSLEDLPGLRAGYFDFIQTDAVVHRGNSGGALLNMRGEVVGINTAINAKARGISFAIPVNVVKAVIPHLVTRGRVVRGYLGIGVDDLDWKTAVRLGLDTPRGVLVTRVKPGTPAQRSGVKAGDVILALAGAKVRRRSDLSWRVGTWPVGKPLSLRLWRQGEALLLTVTPMSRE